MLSFAMRIGSLDCAHRQPNCGVCDIRPFRYIVSFFDYRCKVRTSARGYCASERMNFNISFFFNISYSFGRANVVPLFSFEMTKLGLYNFLLYCSSAVAKNISNDCFALVFGFNTFLSLAFQSILTVFVVSEWLFKLDIREQYLVYGGYFMVLTIIYCIVGVVNSCMQRNKSIKPLMN